MPQKSKEELIKELKSLNNFEELGKWCEKNSEINEFALYQFEAILFDEKIGDEKTTTQTAFEVAKGQILKGLEKYGVLIDEAIDTLSFVQLERHKFEEIYDSLVYEISMNVVEE